MHLHRLAALSLLGGIVLALPVSAASPSGSPTQATFGIAPGTNGHADSRGLIRVVTGPGVVLHDQVVLQNASTFPITLDVYPSDAVSTAQGEFALGAADVQPRDAGSWIHLDAAHRRVTLAGRTSAGPSTAVVPVVIVVPSNAIPGDHAAGIVAALSSKVVAGKNQQITLVQRVGTRVYIRVGGQLRPHLVVDGLSARYADNWNPIGAGKARVRFTLRNDGNVKLGARVRVTVSGLWGPTRVLELTPLSLLLPGARLPESVEVRGVFPSFFEHAKVRVEALAVQGDADPRVAPSTRSVAFLAVPWSLLGCILALLLVWWLWRRWVRHKATQPDPTLDSVLEPGPEPATPADWPIPPLPSASPTVQPVQAPTAMPVPPASPPSTPALPPPAPEEPSL